MALVLVLSVFVLLPIGAKEAKRYFVFDALEDESGAVYRSADDKITLPLSEAIAFKATDLSLLSPESNAFYISLQNVSNATEISVSYTYKSTNGFVTQTVKQALAAGTDKQVLTLHILPEAEKIETLSISFSAGEVPQGSVILCAFLDISTYYGGEQEEVTLSRCHYSAEDNELQIQGSLSYAATVRYEGETLALFAIGEGESVHLSGKTPLAKTEISFHFSFSVPIIGNDGLFLRYVVAAITSTGERVPLCAPTYPSLPGAVSDSAEGFKGYHSKDFVRVMENIPDFGVVDVYLDRLFASQNNGVLYAGEYDYYYFDQEYIADIERRVQNLTGIGASVYLRLLVGNGRDTLSFADEAPVGAVNRLAVLRNENARRDLYAAIDFLTGRFQEKRTINGLIFGRSADLISRYSYCDATSLAEYSAFFAATFNLVAGVARQNLPELRVLLPVSDAVWDQSADALENNKDFFPELFLPSLLSALEAQILEPQRFGLILESETLSDRVGGEDASHVGIDRLPEFFASLEKAAAEHHYLDENVFFSWQPHDGVDAAKLHADYLLKYATLAQNERVLGFLLDFSPGEAQGESTDTQSLDYLARYINTDRVTDAAQLALSALELESLSELWANAAQLTKRRVNRTDLTKQGYGTERAVKGSVPLWSFSSAEDTAGWYQGTASSSFFVSSANQQTHTLVAQFSGEGAIGEIAYHFNSPVDLSFAPLFVIPVAVKGTAGTRYEVQLRLIANGALTYASAVVNEGENAPLYLDLTDASFALTDLRAIRVMARPLDGESGGFELHFGGMNVQSTELDEKALSDRVNAIWQNNAADESGDPERDYAVPLLVTAIVVVASLVVCVLFAMHHKRKKRKNLK
jgi:hypothetical protein